MHFVSVDNNVRVYFQDCGHGPTLVFVHGGGMSHRMWEQQVFALEPRFRTISYDQRGHGDSDKPDQGYGFDRLGADLVQLLDHCGVQHCCLITHGIGAYTALTAALQDPERIRGLVLAASGATILQPRDARSGFSHAAWRQYLEGVRHSKVQANTSMVAQSFFHQDPGEATRRAIVDDMQRSPLFVLSRIADSIADTDLGSRLGQLSQPVLLIHGVHDHKQPLASAKELQRHLPRAELLRFEHSAHCPHLEELDAFNAAVTQFVLQDPALSTA